MDSPPVICSADFRATSVSPALPPVSPDTPAFPPVTLAGISPDEASLSMGTSRDPMLELKNSMERHYTELETIFAWHILQSSNHDALKQSKLLPDNRYPVKESKAMAVGDKDHNGGLEEAGHCNGSNEVSQAKSQLGVAEEDDGHSEGHTPDDSQTQGSQDEATGPRRSSAPSGRYESFSGRTHEIEDGMYKKNFCGSIVRNKTFDKVCAVVIILSSLLVGIEVELRTDANQFVFDVVGYAFIAFYSGELLVRIGARGRTFLSKSPDQNWNIFDMFCVSSSYLEVTLSHLQSEENGSVLLLLRTIRLVRIARIIRVVRFLGSLRLMVFTVLGAMKMLGWASLLIFMLTYMVSVSFTEAAKSVLQNPALRFHGDRDRLEGFFGTLPKSMMSLFQSIANGVSWREPMLELEGINGMYALLFTTYICITVLTILNVITGLCCDYAINNANVDRDDAIRATLKEIDKWRKQFSFTFQSLDKDGSGEISADELGQMLYDEEFIAYLSYLNVSVDDVLDLFDVFDLDGSGQVSLEEFVAGCMKVKGSAKSLDLMKVKKDIMLLRQDVGSLRLLLQPATARK